MPDDITQEWQSWRRELPTITEHPVSRCYFFKDKERISIVLVTPSSMPMWESSTFRLSIVMPLPLFLWLSPRLRLHLSCLVPSPGWNFAVLCSSTSSCRQSEKTYPDGLGVCLDVVLSWINSAPGKLKAFE